MSKVPGSEIQPSASDQRAADRMFPNKKMNFSLGAIRTLNDLRQYGGDYSDIAGIQRCNIATLNRRLERFRTERFDRTNPEDVKVFSDILRRSGSDKDVRQELADYRMFELRNDVMATPFALNAFQSIDLSADELPAILRPRPRNLQRFTVRTVGQDGGARQDQWRTFRELDQYEMDMISSDKVEYPIRDIQQGRIPEIDEVNTEINYDMEMKIDALALANINAAKATSGLRALLKIYPSIDVNNIPDSNYMDLTAVNPGVITIDKLKTMLLQILLWGAAGGADAPLQISSIFLSPQNMRDPWDFVNLTTNFLDNGSGTDKTVRPVNTVPTDVRESIYQTGMFSSAWGQTFNWQPNAQISKGTLYVTYTQPLGWYFQKSEFDQTIVWDGPDQVEQNYGQTLVQRCLQFVVPNLWQYRILIVKF